MTKEVIVKRVKQIGGVAITIGVSTIVGNAAKFVTPETVKGLTKACVALGSFALGAMASDATVKYASEQIDMLSDAIDVEIEPDEDVNGTETAEG